MRDIPLFFRLWFAFCVAMIPVAIIIQIGVFNECRAQGNSFFYCMNLISHK